MGELSPIICLQAAVVNDDAPVLLNKLDVLMTVLFSHIDCVCHVTDDGTSWFFAFGVACLQVFFCVLAPKMHVSFIRLLTHREKKNLEHESHI